MKDVINILKATSNSKLKKYVLQIKETETSNSYAKSVKKLAKRYAKENKGTIASTWYNAIEKAILKEAAFRFSLHKLLPKATQLTSWQVAYDYVADFSEGLANVSLNWKHGFVNKKGELVIDCIYDYPCSFSGGRAKVRLNNESFYIDKKGNRID